MANALRDRLAGIYDESFVQQLTPPFPRASGFALHAAPWGTQIADVKTIVIHQTAGWPARARAKEFLERYRRPARHAYGIGPQFFVSGDGTVARFVGERILTYHATFLNGHALGIETGHRQNRDPINARNSWEPLGPGDRDDVPGQRLYALNYQSDLPHEVCFAWYPTAAYTGPNGSTAVETGALYPESQYRALALLVRYLAELVLVPRNFPLFPWATRSGEVRSPAGFVAPRLRGIAKADERFEPILDRLIPFGFTAEMFGIGLGDFRAQYDRAVIPLNANKNLNGAWRQLFYEFRGFHGHGFAGAITHHDDHTLCPGPLFDWHRFAREVWDWWWYPFDFNDAFSAPATTRRAYGMSPGLDTPLIEYFYENTPADIRPDPYVARSTPPDGPAGGLIGAGASPSTFRLAHDTPIYAMANGHLVAARLMPPAAGVSMSFALVRHDVYHAPELTTPAAPTPSGRIDYNQPPATVYSLYMHLGGIDRMNFAEVTTGNPDWLNRVLIRKKECDLAIDATGQLNPVLQATAVANFSRPEPAAANRPTSLELLRMDQARLATFLAELQAGEVATPPSRRYFFDAADPTPVNILLGDFLGLAGVIGVGGGVSRFGTCIQIFSRTLIDPTFFTEVLGKVSWEPPAGVAHPALFYQSEWSRTLNAVEQFAVLSAGGDPSLVRWWTKAAGDQLWDVRVPAAAKLSWSGQMYHYAPLDFLQWINDVTWASEWPKYRLTNSDGTPQAKPARPRRRRVS